MRSKMRLAKTLCRILSQPVFQTAGFPLTKSPQGDWNIKFCTLGKFGRNFFPLTKSPQGDWNFPYSRQCLKSLFLSANQIPARGLKLVLFSIFKAIARATVTLTTNQWLITCSCLAQEESDRLAFRLHDRSNRSLWIKAERRQCLSDFRG